MEGVSESYYDVGRWWLRGDTLCHQWDGWFDGLRKCHGVVADGVLLTSSSRQKFSRILNADEITANTITI